MKSTILLSITLLLLASPGFSAPLGSAFTYQGRLTDAGERASGSYDFTFALYDASTGGARFGAILTNTAVAVSNGVFTTSLDFGPAAFDGSAYWLELGVRAAGGGAFSAVPRRQFLSAAPYALHAARAGSVTNGVIQNPSFIGTTGNTPLELFVNGSRALRLEPSGGSVNVIAGHSANTALPGSTSASIAGGYQNAVRGDFVSVGGGALNLATNWSATVGGGAYNTNTGYAGTIGGGEANLVRGVRATVAGGASNVASNDYSTVGGGTWNIATGDYSTIGGGFMNTAAIGASTVAGGYQNVATNGSAIAGGVRNFASGSDGFVGGGTDNTNRSYEGVIGGGALNRAEGFRTMVGGGYQNAATGDNAAVAGGVGNVATGYACSIGGGYENDARGDNSVVSGGAYNLVTNWSATVAGGIYNTNTGFSGFVGGGELNLVGGTRAAVSGGFSNRSSGDYSVVAGGRHNVATGTDATIGGGYQNSVGGFEATVAGGYANNANNQFSTVGGGAGNFAGGAWSTVPGGETCAANADFSFAAGRRAKANHGGAFVWADSKTNDFPSTATNQFRIRSVGGALFATAINETTGDPTAGVNLAPAGGSWSSLSDRASKENLQDVSSAGILERLAKVPIHTWNYKAQGADIRHIGPMAQDFAAAFGVGEDDRHITTVDADGVALAAIQGLHQLLREKDSRLETQAAELRELKNRMAALESLLKTAIAKP
jgi:hypothetical protein